ncbi:MAG TPA: ATP-binding protein [Chloroflexota bacterium]
MDDALQFLTQATLVLIGLLTTVDYLRARGARRLDAAVAFGSLGLVILLGLPNKLLAEPLRPLTVAVSFLLMAHPYTLLRVARHFQPVNPWVLWAALAGTIISGGLLAVTSEPPIPLPTLIALVADFVIFDGYAAVLFVQGAVSATGERRRRLQFAATGAGLFAATLLTAGINAAVPDAAAWITPISRVLSLLAVIAFYFGFAPPNWIWEIWARQNLQKKLAATLLATGAVPVIVIGAFVYGPARSTLTATALQGLDSTAAVQEARIRSAVQSYLDIGRLIGSRTALRQNLDGYGRTEDVRLQASMLAILDDAKSSAPEVLEVSVIGLSGNVAASTDRSAIGEDRAATALLTNQSDYQLLGLSLASGALVGDLGGPLYNEGRLIGFLLVRSGASRLLAITDDYAALGQTGETVLAQPTPDGGALFLVPARFDRSSAFRREVAPADSDPIVQAVNGRQVAVSDSNDYRGHRVLAATRYLSDLGWGLVVKMDEDEAYRPAAPILMALLLALLALLVATPVAAVLVARTISGPLVHLTRVATSIQSGDLSARASVKRWDEIGTLASQFNEMAAALATRTSQLRAWGDELDAVNRELSDLNRTLERRVAERTADLEAQSRELARSNADLEQFAYVASHDLQEPLRVVASYAQLIGRRYKGQLDENADRFIGHLVDAAARMQQLINDLLAYSRLGTRGAEFQAVDLEEVFEHVTSNLAAAIAETETEVTHDPLPTVNGDAVQLSRVFQNLIANAIKFRRPEAPEIHVGAERANGDWQLSVRDNGLGIDPGYFDRIFIIFQRLHGADEYPGSGMGLAISKRIVERHGGRIWVESTPAEGSCFYFTIPADERSDRAERPRDPRSELVQMEATSDPN